MDTKKVIALVQSNIKKHKEGKIDRLPTASQYAKQANLTISVFEALLLKLTEKEQAYCYNHECNDED